MLLTSGNVQEKEGAGRDGLDWRPIGIQSVLVKSSPFIDHKSMVFLHCQR